MPFMLTGSVALALHVGAMLDEVMNDTSPEMERMVARRLYVGELPEAAFAEWNA